MKSRISRLDLWSAFLGNFFEHYDTALYGFLAPFIAPLFFPNEDPITALILSYLIIPMGMLARPIGALVFGQLGDVLGRRRILFITLSGMAAISAAIALCPTYQQAGLFAPLFICLAKVLQNFLASGEIMGGAIFLLEQSPEKKHDLLSSLYSSSTIGGILFASLGVYLFAHFGIAEGGWRFLYLFGVVTAVFGCLLRKKKKGQEHEPSSVLPLNEMARTLWEEKKSLSMIALTSGFSYATYSMALVLMNGYIPLVTELSKEQMMGLNTVLLVLDFASLPFFGWMATKVGREKLMFASAAIVAITALPLCMLLGGAGFFSVVIIRLLFVFFGVSFFAPYHAWTQHLLPKKHRYLLISFGYALGSQVLGSPTSAIALWTYKQTGILHSIAWYWILLASGSTLVLGSLLFARRRRLAEQ